MVRESVSRQDAAKEASEVPDRGTIQHDLTNALTAIQGRLNRAQRHARQLSMDGSDRDRLQSDFTDVEAAIQEMARRIDRL